MQCLDTRQPSTDHDYRSGSPKFSKDFDGKALSSFLKVFYICLELPSDSEKYFGFVVEKFSALVRTTKCDVCDTKNYLWLHPPVRTHRIWTECLI